MSWTEPIWSEAVYDEEGLVSYEARYEETPLNWVASCCALAVTVLIVCYSAALLTGGL